MTDQTTRAGFVAIIGAPNAGKSTLMNQLVGQKIAIATPKVQTTRVNMRGIVTLDNTQFVFVDTPGIYRPETKRLLDKSMVGAAWQASSDADAILLMVDASIGFSGKFMEIVERLKETKGRTPAYLALNKVDLVNKETLFPLMEKAHEMGLFEGIFAISAAHNDGAMDMLKHLEKHMPESEYLYDEESITDMPMRMLAAELTREKVFLTLHQEIPYGIAVETVQYTHQENGHIRIDQNILIERENYKKIVIGQKGQTLKHIGQRARKELEEMLETRVHLFLKVKVNEKWSNSESFMNEIGLDPIR